MAATWQRRAPRSLHHEAQNVEASDGDYDGHPETGGQRQRRGAGAAELKRGPEMKVATIGNMVGSGWRDAEERGVEAASGAAQRRRTVMEVIR